MDVCIVTHSYDDVNLVFICYFMIDIIFVVLFKVNININFAAVLLKIKRRDDAALDCESKVSSCVYLKMKCADREFDENAVYARLLTCDDMDYSKFHGLKKGSVDLLRFVLLNWMSGFFADAEEHQFLISFLPSTSDPDSIIELLK